MSISLTPYCQSNGQYYYKVQFLEAGTEYMYFGVPTIAGPDGDTLFWYWDENIKSGGFFSAPGPSTDEYQALNGSVVAVLQESNKVYLIIFDLSVNPDSDFDYPRGYLKKILVTGSNGSSNIRLLKTSSTDSPNVVTIDLFNVSDSSVFSLEYTGIDCWRDSSTSESTVIKTSCDGFTKTAWYHDGEGNITTEVTPNSTDCGYVAPTVLTELTETQRVEVKQVCSSPVMLKWKNTLGGWDQWVFQKKQTLKEDVDSVGTVTKPIYDISDVSNNIQEIGRNSQPTMVMGSDVLTESQKKGLMHLLRSNKVYMLNESKTGWISVRIVTGGFTVVETDAESHVLEIEVILPQINTIKN